MKSLLFSALLLIGISGQIYAQASFSISPAISYAQVSPNSDTVARAVITNLTNQPLSLTWYREIIAIQPATASTAVLDPYLSFPPFVSTHNFPLMVGDTGEMSIVYFNYSNDPGCALVRILVVNQNNPADSASALYQINDCASVATGEPAPLAVRLFPNPFSDKFNLEHTGKVVQLRFIQMDGREVLRLAATPDQVYAPANLPPGTYTVLLEDAAGKTLQSLLVQKTPW